MLPVVSRQNTTSTFGFLAAGWGAETAGRQSPKRASRAAGNKVRRVMEHSRAERTGEWDILSLDETTPGADCTGRGEGPRPCGPSPLPSQLRLPRSHHEHPE